MVLFIWSCLVGAFFVDDNLDMRGYFLHVLNSGIGSLEWVIRKKLCGAFESNTR
jgi:Co/Zn/Cd efflux system component